MFKMLKAWAFLALAFIAFSCSQSYKQMPIEGTTLEATVYEKDRGDEYEIGLGRKPRVRVSFEIIEASKYPENLEFLVKTLEGPELSITEQHSLANGAFGISYFYTEKPEEKHYLFYFKKGDEHVRFTNNEYYNTDMEHFEHVKSVMASLK